MFQSKGKQADVGLALSMVSIEMQANLGEPGLISGVNKKSG